MRARSEHMQRFYQVLAVAVFLVLFFLSLLSSSNTFVIIPVILSISYTIVKNAIAPPRVTFFDLRSISDRYALRQLPLHDFALMVAQVYFNHGYAVHLNLDQRIQITAVRKGATRIIRCMTYAYPATETDILELVRTRAQTGALTATLATSGEITDFVCKLANRHKIYLMDGDSIMAQIRS